MTESFSTQGFREQLERMGYRTTTKLLNSSIIQASGNVSRKLRIPEETPVMLIERRRYLKRKPISLRYSYIVVCEEIEKHDLVDEQLYHP